MKTYISSIFSEVKEINTSELRLAYLNIDHLSIGTWKYIPPSVPVFWAYYRDELLYCQVDYQFNYFETYDDWKLSNGKDFNPYFPGDEELSHLLQYKITYHNVIPEMLNNEELRLELCQLEEDIIKNWNRNKKINDLLK